MLLGFEDAAKRADGQVGISELPPKLEEKLKRSVRSEK